MAARQFVRRAAEYAPSHDQRQQGAGIFFAVTSAPLMIDLLHDIPFVMGSEYKFAERFDGENNYFVPTNLRKEVRRIHQLGNQFYRRRPRAHWSILRRPRGTG